MTTLQTPLRLFVAIELPEEIQDLLTATQERLREQLGPTQEAIRWTKPESTHLTLQFLGDVPVNILQLVKNALREGCEGAMPLTLQVEGIGAFPNARRPRVVWVGLSGELEALHTLEKGIEEKLRPFGYKPDRPFNPHITLARVREGASSHDLAALHRALAEDRRPFFEPPLLVVNRVSLMRSELGRGGSHYTQLDAVMLEA